jgi:hypothetical protein
MNVTPLQRVALSCDVSHWTAMLSHVRRNSEVALGCIVVAERELSAAGDDDRLEGLVLVTRRHHLDLADHVHSRHNLQSKHPAFGSLAARTHTCLPHTAHKRAHTHAHACKAHARAHERACTHARMHDQA